ncbi:hypothetical protein OESDEN_01275, partial [Oesophagostomum dentatum]
LQNEFNNLNHTTFGVLAIARLPIHSREPETLLVPGKPLLNSNHYAVHVTQGCPYFRTVQNLERCTVLSEAEYQRIHATTVRPTNGTVKVPHRVIVRNNLVEIIALVVFLCLVSVSVLGTFFYCHGRKATMGRFETVPKEAAAIPK